MTQLSGGRAKRAVAEPVPTVGGLGEEQAEKKPIKVWAFVGGVILAFQLYVWGKWISGPNFERVPPGPTDPPTFMKVILLTWTGVICIGLPIALYFFIVRPWIRERRITLDGMLLISMGLMFFQDPLLNYFNTWSTYNTWMFNRGSWVQDIPGWQSFGEPGAMMAEPVLMNAPGYAFGVLLCTMFGCWIMRKAKQRWPGISNAGLVGIVVVWAFFFDLVIEGLFLMPMGLFTYPGAIPELSINAGTYYQWPLYEGLMWGGAQAAFCCLRYFTDDRGRTVAERGLDHIKGGFAKQQFTRFLAIFAAVSACFFVFYNIPAQVAGMHAAPWPDDIKKRSYFLMGVCGDGTDRLCPDPRIPMHRNGSGYINDKGELVMPEGVEIPKNIPVDRGDD